jgi:hypothetical protein
VRKQESSVDPQKWLGCQIEHWAWSCLSVMVLREPKPHPFAVATPATTPRAESVDKVVHAAVPDGGYHRAFEVAPQPFEKIEAGTVWWCPLDRQVRLVDHQELLHRFGGGKAPGVT